MNRKNLMEAKKVAQISKAIVNKSYKKTPFPNAPNSLNNQNMANAAREITSWDGYCPTPLHSLTEIAAECGVKAVLYKDESTRFDLRSFKALGGSYAVASLIRSKKSQGFDASNITVTTATDGNHGRSVSWGAKLAGCKARIYIHEQVSVAREKAMQSFGADVVRINGNYEASLAACKRDAEANDWVIVSDTSWEGYRDIPLQVMAGYSIMSQEILQQMGSKWPTHAFLPIGVGGLAAGVVAPLWQSMNKDLCKLISVESDMSACFLESIASKVPTLVEISEETIMAGLSCGEISSLAWDILQPSLSHCLSITDDAVAPLMRFLGLELDNNLSIEAGECSTAGLAALLAASQDPRLWSDLELNEDSIVLLIGTEGATDQNLYQSIMDDAMIPR